MPTLPDENDLRPFPRTALDRRLLAIDREHGLYSWAVVKIPGEGARPHPKPPRYLQHGRVLPLEDRTPLSPARVQRVIAGLLSAYVPSMLVLTARPPLRAASAEDPYAFLAEAQARSIPVVVVDPARLFALLPPGARDLTTFPGLRARPSPEGAARALAAATAAALDAHDPAPYRPPAHGPRANA